MDKISTVKKNILQFIDDQGIKKEDFYKKTGLSSSNFKGKNLISHLGSDKIVDILTAYPNLTADWLFTDRDLGQNINQTKIIPKVVEQQKKEDPFQNLTIDKKLNLIFENINSYNKKLSDIDFRLKVLSSISTKAFELLFENFEMETMDTEEIENLIRTEINSEQ